MQNVIHIATDSSHSVHLAKMLSEVQETTNSHVDHLLIVPGVTHGKSVLKEIQSAFPRAQTLEGNVNLPQPLNVCIFHGMFQPVNFKLMRYFESLGVKLLWVVWGGDLYKLDPDNLPEWTKLFSGIIGSELDSDLLVNFDGVLFSAPNFYMPKTEKREKITSDKKYDLRIIVGNSGDPSNRHMEILETFKRSRLKLLITMPLAYNTLPPYRAALESLIEHPTFPHKVEIQDSLMSTNDYAELFARSDLAVYHHARQQAVGSMRLAVKAGCPLALDFEIPSRDGRSRINPSLPNLIKMGATRFFDTNFLIKNFSDSLLLQIAESATTTNVKVNSDESMQILDYMRLLSVISKYDKDK